MLVSNMLTIDTFVHVNDPRPVFRRDSRWRTCLVVEELEHEIRATLGRYPVGSGDAFLGGLAVGLVGGASLGGALRLASAAAAANAVMPGAGDLDPATLERLR